ncbi:hypothetical protein ACBO_16940 [Acinetobacter bouvetii]|nr:hypothetical protein ACBO_16940 [Acinetobacter bouvetii]
MPRPISQPGDKFSSIKKAAEFIDPYQINSAKVGAVKKHYCKGNVMH